MNCCSRVDWNGSLRCQVVSVSLIVAHRSVPAQDGGANAAACHARARSDGEPPVTPTSQQTNAEE